MVPLTSGTISTTNWYWVTLPEGAPHCIGMKSKMNNSSIQTAGESFHQSVSRIILSLTSNARTAT